MKKKITKIIISVVLAAITAAMISLGGTGPQPVTNEMESAPSTSAAQIQGEQVTAIVAKVVDGDTIELQDGTKVRYIGVDTPETVDPRRAVGCYGKEAAAKNKELVEGKTVRLEKDVSETDKYGRLLRYVYVDEVMINQYLVQNGFAKAASYPPDVKYQSLFLQAQKQAQQQQWGMWSAACTEAVAAFPPTISPDGDCSHDCAGTDLDCRDFTTQAQAQTFFECCNFTADNDPMRLDSRDGKSGNNLACESLP